MVIFLLLLILSTIHGQYLLTTNDGRCPVVKEWRIKGTMYVRLYGEKERLITQNRILEENYKERLNRLKEDLLRRRDELIRTNLRLQLMVDLDSIKVKDCQWFLDKDYNITSGVYKITVGNSDMVTYCDMDTQAGGWTVIFLRNKNKPMSSSWEQYKQGFGSVAGNFWIGNENILKLIDERRTEMYIRFEDESGTSFCSVYTDFTISSEIENYRINYNVQSYSASEGTEDCYIGETVFSEKNVSFSTFDKDNDKDPGNCAEINSGGWWYGYCNSSHMTGGTPGLRVSGKWRNLSTAAMMIRPMLIINTTSTSI